MGVLAAMFGGVSVATSGPSKKATQTPPLNAASSDEADFIKYIQTRTPPPPSPPPKPDIWVTDSPGRKFLDEAEADKSKEKH